MFHFRATISIFVCGQEAEASDYHFVKQRDKVRNKIMWTLDLIEDHQRVPEVYLKHIESTDGLFEIRVSMGATFFGSSASFPRGNWWCWRTGFRRRAKRHQNRKLKEH